MRRSLRRAATSGTRRLRQLVLPLLDNRNLRRQGAREVRVVSDLVFPKRDKGVLEPDEEEEGEEVSG